MKTDFLLKSAKKSVPYIAILALSLIGTILVFWQGLCKGDDYFYHIPNILDKYNSIINGRGLVGISSELANGFGYGAGLFYSPLSHFTVVVLGVVLNVFGISLMTSYKLVVVLSVFLSGVFMYGFALKFTNGNKLAALISAACLIIYPYRLFNLFCRAAFAEAFAFAFMPLFFSGVYEVTHMERKDVRIMPFLKLVLGASFLFLSHNITAMFAFIVGFLFYLIYSKRLFNLFKEKKYIIYTVASALLIIGISAIALFSQLELLMTDYYAVSNDVSMRTDLESVLKHTDNAWSYSGFLNISFLGGKGYSASSLYSGIVMYLISCVLFVFIDNALVKIKKLRWAHYPISTSVLFVLVSLVRPRLEIYLGTIIFIALYFLVSFSNRENKERAIYSRPIFWFSISVIILTFFIMTSAWFWTLAPGFLRTIQFPWRLWSFIQMFLSILIGVLAQHFAKKKAFLFGCAIFIGLLMVLNMPIIEKRNATEDKWYDEISDTSLDKSAAIGHQKEYCPQIYRETDYTPRENSLYKEVRKMIFKSTYDRTKKLSPVFLTGEGELLTSTIVAPKSEMQITVTEKAEIQMPLFYYPGYKVHIEDENGKISKIKPYDVDGLVAFELEKGNYIVKTNFVGSPVRIIGKTLTIVSSFIVILILLLAICRETPLINLLEKFKKQKARI